MKVKIAAVAIIGLAAVGTLYSGLRAQDAPSGSRSVWDGVYTQEQAERGHSLYNRHCASCHGDELAGVRLDIDVHRARGIRGHEFRRTGKRDGSHDLERRRIQCGEIG